ncbi:MAG: hypothetical protein PHE68_03510 [Candidatus Peribacteraceae bacterium]|nr:hypothetical protein [Candidatus Peribacteraceae bacterium]MDD5074730.1 hypothetical protein [Candidatus Peribacteraceae bacterium]
MAVSRLFRHLILDAGLFLLVGGFLIVSTGWQPSWLRGQISSVCVDTDGWANILMWGKAIGNAMTKEDYCKDTKTNMEAYCTVTGPSTIAIPCPGACIRGVCYPSSSSSRSFSYSSSSSSSSSFSFTSSSSSSSRSTSSFSPPLYCTDSDSGLNYEVTGNVIDDSSGRRIVIWDTCMNNKTVAEAYCSQSGPTTHAHTCPGWCDGGRCVQFSSNSSIPVFSSSSSVSCTDSDSGQAFFSRGTAAGSNGRQITDICTDSKTLVEAYCAASGPATVTHTCPWQCVDGRCVQAASSVRSSLSSSSLSSVPSPLCTDSDNGIDYDRRGKVTWNGVDVEDICVDGKTIAERYCSESGPLTIIARCDEKCVNGACGKCNASGKIAFVSCDSSVVINDGSYDIDRFDCTEILADRGILQGYDTIVYLGPSGANGALPLIEQRLMEGAKVIIFGQPQLYSIFGGVPTPLGLTLHYHNLKVPDYVVTVTDHNGMSDAFIKDDVRLLGYVQMYADSMDWCGDLFFTGASYNGHFHGYLLDNEGRKGLLLFVGLTYYETKMIDFSDPFLAAQLDQQWDPSEGISDPCGLECRKNVGYGVGKPVIYLYPEQEQEVKIQLTFDGELVTTYPKYNEDIRGWDVIAHPDGTMTDLADGQDYNYIFWNGISSTFSPDFSSGFVVKGKDTRKFLQDALARQGLRSAEYNEMIVYWLPYMEHHKYNLIHFAKDEYTRIAKMNITPTPDALLRVFMVFRELQEPLDIPPQTFEPFDRHGFSAVEWGGSEIDGDWKVIR